MSKTLTPGERFCETCDRKLTCSKHTWWLYGYPQDCEHNEEYRAWLKERSDGAG